MRERLIAALLGTLSTLAPTAAPAFTCRWLEPAELIEKTPIIFEGVVDAIVLAPQHFRVAVLRVFKGRVTRNVVVYNDMDSALLAGRIPLVEGERTIFYVSKASGASNSFVQVPNGALVTNTCRMFPGGLTIDRDRSIRANSAGIAEALLNRLGSSEPDAN